MQRARVLVTYLIVLMMPFFVQAQDKWDLKTCIDYAIKNNISVKQADVQARLAALTLEQSRLSLLPRLSGSVDLGYSAGRNQNPVNFELITQGFLTSGVSVQSGADLFNWFAKRNTIEANKLEFQAAEIGVEKVRYDIALNVAAAYLQVLLANEQIEISKVQVQQSLAQLQNTLKLVEAGSLPELNAAELEAQLARDSSTLVSSEQSLQLNTLQLKALLNVDAASRFDVVVPPVATIPLEPLADLEPEYVYKIALVNMPTQRQNEYRLKAGEKMVAVNKAALYPSFSAFASLGSSFNNKEQKIVGATQIPIPPSKIGDVSVGGVPYEVFGPALFRTDYNYKKYGYFDQINNNFRQSIGLSMSVPIFNGGTARTAYKRSKINIESLNLQTEQDNQTLKQNIYKAHLDATTALQKYNSGLKSVSTAQKAYDFARKRYENDLLSSIDLIVNQNNLFKAKTDLVLAQYDYVFKMKVLEFYKGQGIKL